MRGVYITGKIATGLTILLGIIYLSITWDKVNNKGLPASSDFILETYKTLLTFSLITIGSILLKSLVDQVIEKDKSKQVEINRYEETRKTIFKEFAVIFSGFYAVRKLYHSALYHHHIYSKSSNDFNILIKDLLQRSVELEGRYGALKVLIISHFSLPEGNFYTKNVYDLKEAINREIESKKTARLSLDLLGEYYDDWRHAFENNTEIKIDSEFWNRYDILLNFLEKG